MKEQQNQTWMFKMFIWNIGEPDSFFLKSQFVDIHKKVNTYLKALSTKSLQIHLIMFQNLKSDYYNCDFCSEFYILGFLLSDFTSTWLHVYYRNGELESKICLLPKK